MRVLAIAAAISAFTVSFTGLIDDRTGVDAKCYPGRSSSWGTWLVYQESQYHPVPPDSLHGVEAYIYNYDPFVWPIHQYLEAHSMSWVMLNDHSQHWAQIGFQERLGDERYTFIQVKYGPTLSDIITMYFPPHPENGWVNYRVEYWGYFQFFAGDIGYGALPPQYSFTPNRAQIAGEITNRASQMPGGYQPGYRESFLLSKVHTGGWVAFAGQTPVNYDPNEFGFLAQYPYTLYIWDQRCPQ